MMPGQWLGIVLYIPFSPLTLMVGLQKGHPAHKNTSTNLQRFSPGTDGRGLKADPGSP